MVHENIMDQFRRADFVSDDTIRIDDFSAAGAFIMQGEIACQGNIVVTVQKILDIVAWGDVPEVRTSHYSYNVRVLGQHNVFRYDNCHVHEGHSDAHHKDVFDFKTGDKAGTFWIGEGNWPTLQEVIEEARKWWSQNYAVLREPNAYPSIESLVADVRSPFGPI